MRKNNILAILILLFLILLSCSREEIGKNEIKYNVEQFNAKDSSNFENDSIIQLREEDFPKIDKRKNRFLGEESVWSQLYQLNGLEFYLQTQDSFFGKNTLQTNGKNKSLSLGVLSSSNNQLFYIKFLPPSTGIQYLIYSRQENVPIGVGSYVNDPKSRILYAASVEMPRSLFGFSWDFIPNKNKNGFFIQNEDIVEQGTGDGYMIYYDVITNNQGNVSLERQNDNSLYQQFNIVPNDEFIIEQMDMNIDDAQILSSTPTVIAQKIIENASSEAGTRSVTFTESRQDSYSFRKSSGISYQMVTKADASFKLFKIIQTSSSFSISTGNTTTLEYSTNNIKTVSLSETYSVPVPAQTKSVLTFNAMRHKVRVPYTATLRGKRTKKLINIGGFFEAVDYTTSTLRVENYSLNNNKLINTSSIKAISK